MKRNRQSSAKVSDRALRYRAVSRPPEGRKICAMCGSKRFVGVDHVDGLEENSAPKNLMWACKSCNTKKGFAFKRAGVGRRTVQFNSAARGVADIERWLVVVMAVRGDSDAMPVSDAVAAIQATPPVRRAEFAAELAGMAGMKRNPAEVPSLAQYAWAVAQGGPNGRRGSSAEGAFDEAGAIIHATPKRKRAEYARSMAENKRSRRNPADAAADGFKMFHGHEPEVVVRVRKRKHEHRFLTGAGKLTHLVVNGIDRKKHTIRQFKGALLAFNEALNQLFVEGGDQSINLEDFGIKKPHELETLGQVTDIGYHTVKSHLGAEGGDAVYVHGFRTTNEDGRHVVVSVKRYPDLIYRVLDQQLEFSGGSYEIRREGIDF